MLCFALLAITLWLWLTHTKWSREEIVTNQILQIEFHCWARLPFYLLPMLAAGTTATIICCSLLCACTWAHNVSRLQVAVNFDALWFYFFLTHRFSHQTNSIFTKFIMLFSIVNLGDVPYMPVHWDDDGKRTWPAIWSIRLRVTNSFILRNVIVNFIVCLWLDISKNKKLFGETFFLADKWIEKGANRASKSTKRHYVRSWQVRLGETSLCNHLYYI